ncbi:YdcF family protein [Salipiger aestuarii]|uniref:DUF218 domain-containing protein n=1 Tax=Salipiger aestuarii TaxID=568098 RepID=A0A327YGM6_9RHOB|nr:YdcF family protein [Salipiger aestuarii]KAA8613029.1 hypothetical protein AL037_05805 [Salipiger aestuarii]KAB2542497.1 hypothetical protein AL035_06275 [Salipiger aestuarii]RAK18965.1 DUF218 domain-containing protein [Salipiger aestuarii]
MKTGSDDLPVALVLGAAVWSGGMPSPALRRRALAGARLWTGGRVRAIVACGGQGAHAPAEAAVIARLCHEAGVPRSVVFCEDQSTTTLENIQFARPVLRQIGAREVIVVSDFYHLPRALMVARRSGVSARGVAVALTGARPGPQVKAVLREIPALGWYFLSGKGR